MKNPIKIGDEIVFLYDYSLMRGKILKVNGKTYKIDVPAQGALIAFIKNVNKDRVANIKDKFTVVWLSDKGVRGSYRIDYNTYPNENKDFRSWSRSWDYIQE